MKKAIYVILFFSLFSCSLLKKGKITDHNNYNSENPIIMLKKISGYGKVPNFEIVITGDGKAILIGKKNLNKIGKYEMHLKKRDIDNLVNSFKKVKFWELKDEYTARVTDLPTTFISYTYNGKTKKVKDYFGAPESLKKLEKKIENYIKLDGWVKAEE